MLEGWHVARLKLATATTGRLGGPELLWELGCPLLGGFPGLTPLLVPQEILLVLPPHLRPCPEVTAVLDKPRTLCCGRCHSLVMALGQMGGALRGEEPVTSAPRGQALQVPSWVCALPALGALTGQAGGKAWVVPRVF